MYLGPVAQVETEKRRLTILCYLASAPGYEAVAMLLLAECRRRGVPTSSGQLLQALTWLGEVELITLRGIAPDPVARITLLGREAAQGLTFIPGVLPPDP